MMRCHRIVQQTVWFSSYAKAASSQHQYLSPIARRCASSRASSVAQGLNFKTRICVGKVSHEAIADMPVDGGGKAEAPSPKDFVMAGLTACTSMTIQTRAKMMIASGKLKDGALKEVTVEAIDETIEGSHMPSKVEVVVGLEGDITDVQRRQLMAAVKACPVKRMLQGELEGGVSIRMKEREGSASG